MEMRTVSNNLWGEIPPVSFLGEIACEVTAVCGGPRSSEAKERHLIQLNKPKLYHCRSWEGKGKGGESSKQVPQDLQKREIRLHKICYGIKPCVFMDPQRDALTSVASLPAPTSIPPAFPGKQQHLLKGKDTPGEQISLFLWDMKRHSTAKSSCLEKSLAVQSHAKGCLPVPCSGAAPTGSSKPTAEPRLIWEGPT